MMASDHPTVTTKAVGVGSKDPKAVKLRSYLDARIKSARVGAPQTKTESLLESLLDETKTKRKAKAHRKGATRPKAKYHNTAKSSTINVPLDRRQDIHPAGESQSIWSQANIQKCKASKSAATSLDDLLGPMRPPQKKSLKRTAARKSNIALKLKRAESIISSKQKIKDNTMVEKSSNDCGSSLPSRVVIKLPGAKHKSFRKKAKIPSTSFTHINNTKHTHIIGSGTATATAEVIGNPSTATNLETNKLVTPVLPSPPIGNIASSNDNYSRADKSLPLMTENARIPSPSTVRTKQVDRTIEPLAHYAKPIATIASTSIDKLKKRKVNNDNFVRLNMKNTAGACKGARSLKQHNRMKRRRAEWKQRTNQLGVEENEDDDGEKEQQILRRSTSGKRMNSIQAAIDPLDDFLDGKFHTKTKPEQKQGASQQTSRTHPVCPRHQRPCKLLVVKKNTSGNKGRKFYACSLPRGEQCDFFQWEEDTVEVRDSIFWIAIEIFSITLLYLRLCNKNLVLLIRKLTSYLS